MSEIDDKAVKHYKNRRAIPTECNEQSDNINNTLHGIEGNMSQVFARLMIDSKLRSIAYVI